MKKMFRQQFPYPIYNIYGYQNHNPHNFNTTYYSNLSYINHIPQVDLSKPSYYQKQTEDKTQENNIQNQESKVCVQDDTLLYEKSTVDKSNNKESEIKKNTEHRLGPISLNKNTLSIFGFSIEIDDLILIGLILILLLDSECDYTLLIVLGLMLFNINLGSLSNLSFFS
ncbi:MAG: hypothetical protein RSD14_02860 [Clostridia bacterium]